MLCLMFMFMSMGVGRTSYLSNSGESAPAVSTALRA